MMRKYLAASLALFFVGLLCCAQSPSVNFPPGVFQSRAALDAATNSCPSPTIITLADPNDWSTGNWSRVNVIGIGGQGPAPDTTNTASTITSTTTGFAGANSVTVPGTLTGGTCYQITGYVSANGTGPNWVELIIFDSVSEAFGVLFDKLNGGFGTDQTTTNATLFNKSFSNVGTGGGATNWYKVTFSGSFASTVASPNAIFYYIFQATSSGGNATLGQDGKVWQWGCNSCSP